jgi:mercuric ion binding protein
LLSAPPVLASDVAAKFTVDNMTCATCPIAVRTAMERVAGVKSVIVDFDNKSAVVVYDDSVATAEPVAQASADIGFPARLETAP